jgi:NhaP-type Na+/H+ or K+/H+ antiporter
MLIVLICLGAISYALSVHVGQYYGADEEELKRTLVTTTLITVLFTILVLGGLTMPVVKFLRRNSSLSTQQRSLESSDDMDRHTMMSKTMQFDELLNEDENYMHQRKHIINDDNDNYEIQFANPNTIKGLEKINEIYIKPLLIRKASLRPNDEQEIRHHDRKPLLSSNGKKSSFMDDDEEDDEDGEDDLLVVNQLRQENFQLKTIKDTKRTDLISHNT